MVITSLLIFNQEYGSLSIRRHVFLFEFTIDRSCVYIIKHKIPLATKKSSERIIGLLARSQLINIHDKIDIRIIEVRIIEFAGLYYD